MIEYKIPDFNSTWQGVNIVVIKAILGNATFFGALCCGNKKFKFNPQAKDVGNYSIRVVAGPDNPAYTYTYNYDFKVTVWDDPVKTMDRVTFRIANVLNNGKIILTFD